MSEFADKIKSWIKEYKFNYTIEDASTAINELFDRQITNDESSDINSIISCIELDTTTTLQSTRSLENKLQSLNEIPIDAPDIASVIIAPLYCKDFSEALKSSQTNTCVLIGSAMPSYIEVLVAEAGLSKMDGANELELYLPTHHYFDDRFDELFDSIAEIKNIATETTLKTRIKIEQFPSLNDLAKVAILALEAGSDGICLESNNYSSQLEIAAFVVADAIKKFDIKSNSISTFKINSATTKEEIRRICAIINYQREHTTYTPSQLRIGTTNLAFII